MKRKELTKTPIEEDFVTVNMLQLINVIKFSTKKES